MAFFFCAFCIQFLEQAKRIQLWAFSGLTALVAGGLITPPTWFDNSLGAMMVNPRE
jgi:hypothetical protein